ncbi:MAG: gluconate 2-dehydrogenase subunit 3 family protein [Bacteroidota bacterium]
MNRREILRYTAVATGAALSAPFATAFLTGCQAEPAVEPYLPEFFSQEEYDFILRFADIIIPRTDTPGASDVGVPQTIDKMVGVVFNAESQEEARMGIQLLRERIDEDTPEGGFMALDDEAALAHLTAVDNHFKDPATATAINTMEEGEAQDIARAKMDTYFQLKGMVIANYFGSKEVATTQLAYLPVPGEYIPCGDLQELTGGKAWAL